MITGDDLKIIKMSFKMYLEVSLVYNVKNKQLALRQDHEAGIHAETQCFFNQIGHFVYQQDSICEIIISVVDLIGTSHALVSVLPHQVWPVGSEKLFVGLDGEGLRSEGKQLYCHGANRHVESVQQLCSMETEQYGALTHLGNLGEGERGELKCVCVYVSSCAHNSFPGQNGSLHFPMSRH